MKSLKNLKGISILSIALLSFCSGTTTTQLSDGSYLSNAQIKSVIALSSTSIQAVFEQSMSDDVEAVANYEITRDDGATIQIFSAAITPNTENKVVTIATGVQASTITYTLKIKSVTSVSGRTAPESGMQKQFRSFSVNLDAPIVKVKEGSINYGSGSLYYLGSIEVGSSSPMVSFTLENSGTQNLNISGSPLVTLAGIDASTFSITQPTKTSLSASETDTFSITFNPNSVGNKTAYFEITTNDPVNPVYKVLLIADVIDTALPTAGGAGTLSVASYNKSSVSLTFTKATDNASAQSTLQYQVYYSTSNLLTSVFLVENVGTAFGSYQTDIDNVTITGLTKKTAYYINVIVKDNEGNKAAYTMVSQTTRDEAELIADINPSGNSSPANLTVFNAKLYFAATDASGDRELWVYDGASAPTRVADINIVGSSNPSDMEVYNGKLYFGAEDSSTERELFSYDGITAPAVALNLGGGATSSDPAFFLTVNTGSVTLLAFRTGYDQRIRLYDGTWSDFSVKIEAEQPVEFDNQAFYSSDGAINGIELGRLRYGDPVYLPTLLVSFGVANINPGSADSNPKEFTVFNNKLYYSADDGINGAELWQTEIIVSQSVYSSTIVANLTTGAGSSNPAYLTVHNSKLYFQVSTDLWEYDGTNAPIKVGCVGGCHPAGSNPKYMYSSNGKLYLQALSLSNGYDLAVFDGGLISELMDINTSGDSNPENFIEFQGAVYFTATDSTNGIELWKVNHN